MRPRPLTAAFAPLLLLSLLAACSNGFKGDGNDPAGKEGDDAGTTDGSDGGDDGSDGTDSASDGSDGADGTDGSDGSDGTDGTDGSDGTDGDDGSTDPDDVDDDGDGLSENEGDCDDTDPDVGPHADEQPYNGIDDDCNSATPDDDLDGDGYDGEEDCDDLDPDVNPGAAEDWTDGVDNDCDGDIDERFWTWTVDSAGNVGSPSAVDVDSSGVVHIAYADTDSGTLKYTAMSTTGSWSAPVDLVSYSWATVGEYIDGKVDGADRFQVAYTFYDYTYTNYTELDFIYRDASGTWSAEYVVEDYSSFASTDVGYFVTMDIDSGNLPTFAWFDAYDGLPYISDYTSFGVAVTLPVDAIAICWISSCYSGLYTSVALDSSDYVNVAYSDPSAPLGLGTQPEAQYTRFDTDLNSVTFSEKIANDGYYTSLALKSDGTRCVAWQNDTSADLLYACRGTGAVWTPTTVDSTGSVGAYAQLAFNSADEPYIVYYDETNHRLKGAHDDGSGWVTFVIDDSADVGQYVDMSIDHLDRVNLSYYDATNGDLVFARGQ